MKKLALALLALTLCVASASAQVPGQGPNNQIGCINSAIYSASTSGSTQMIPAVAGKIIYVCGYIMQAGGTVNIKLTTGTGSACATGSTDLTPLYIFTVGGNIMDTADYFRGMLTPAGQALCVNASAAVAGNVIVYYGQY